MSDAKSETRIHADSLIDAGAATLTTAGCTAAEARTVVSALVEANLFGHDSHGIGMLPLYIENLLAGRARAGQSARITSDHGTLVGIDGQRGFGQVVGAQAMDIAIERAKAHGVCIAGLSNAHHLARIGRWAEQCAAAGLASVHFVNVVSKPLVAPWGGSDARLSTDPFCVGVPHAPHPIILDYATSMVAMGKVRVAFEAEVPMAEGLLLDKHGHPTRDPGVMFDSAIGALLPFGQHKGFALSVMCEILGGALSGGQVQDRHHDPAPLINNMLSIVFVPDRLVSREALAAQIQQLAAWLRASPPRAGGTGVYLPGEPERVTARERGQKGIPLSPGTRDALRACARRVDATSFDRLFGDP